MNHSPDAGLRLHQLTVRLGAHTALSEVSLDVPTGEHLALIGPSGAGKTTLLRCVAGLLRPNAGSVSWDNEAWSDGQTWLPPRRRRIGMIAQEPALWPHLSARRHLLLTLAWRGVAGEQRRDEAEKMLDLVSLSQRAEHKPSQLSGGEAQRLALARALVGGSRLLVLDEPLGQLDPLLRHDLGNEVRDLAKRMGASVLHVTHDPTQALRLADRVAVLEQGRLTQTGTPDQLRDQPASPFVRQVLSLEMGRGTTRH